MKSLSRKIAKAFEKAGIKGKRAVTFSIEEFLNSQHHKDVTDFLKKKKEFEERSKLYNPTFKSGYQNSLAYAI